MVLSVLMVEKEPRARNVEVAEYVNTEERKPHVKNVVEFLSALTEGLNSHVKNVVELLSVLTTGTNPNVRNVVVVLSVLIIHRSDIAVPATTPNTHRIGVPVVHSSNLTRGSSLILIVSDVFASSSQTLTFHEDLN